MKLKEIHADNYDAIFYPRSHGSLWDLVNDQHSIRLSQSFYKLKKYHQRTEKNNLAEFVIDHTNTSNEYQNLLAKNYSAHLSTEKFINANKQLLDSKLQKFTGFDKNEALRKDWESFS